MMVEVIVQQAHYSVCPFSTISILKPLFSFNGLVESDSAAFPKNIPRKTKLMRTVFLRLDFIGIPLSKRYEHHEYAKEHQFSKWPDNYKP